MAVRSWILLQANEHFLLVWINVMGILHPLHEVNGDDYGGMIGVISKNLHQKSGIVYSTIGLAQMMADMKLLPIGP